MTLVEKYNIQVPRYTSYPAYPYWNGAPSWENWINDLSTSSLSTEVYVHIPYCEKLCLYCACNRKITKNHSKDTEYVQAIIDEWNRYHKINFTVSSLHFGGGTPTFLSPKDLSFLIENLLKSMDLESNFGASIEVDPRVTSQNHIKVLRNYPFKRISLGIQDFDPLVQKAIGRIQSYNQVDTLINLIQKTSIESINFDLIYGLPYQTLKSVESTVEKVVILSPDTLALYSYAQVPWNNKHQKSLEKYPMLKGSEKLKLFQRAQEILCSNGYVPLGLDHFAKKNDPLAIAQTQNKLKRNFMGHTLSKSEKIIALGASAISYSGRSYRQNPKEPQDYLEKPSAFNGHQSSPLDQEVFKIIQDITCQKKASFLKIRTILNSEQMLKLKEMENDNLILLEKDSLEVREEGLPFIRNICQVFDLYYKKNSPLKVSSSL